MQEDINNGKISCEPTNTSIITDLQSIPPSLPSAVPSTASVSFILLISRHRYNSQKHRGPSFFYICSTLQPKQCLPCAQKCILQPDIVQCKQLFRAHHPLPLLTNKRTLWSLSFSFFFSFFAYLI